MSTAVITGKDAIQEMTESRDSFDKIIYGVLIQFVEKPVSIIIKSLTRAQRHKLHTFHRNHAYLVSLGVEIDNCRDMKLVWDPSYLVELDNKFQIRIPLSQLDILRQNIYNDIKKHVDNYLANI